MVAASDLSFMEYRFTTNEILEKIKQGQFGAFIEPIFHQVVSECLFGNYPTEKIVTVGNKIQDIIFGNDILETILYIVNDNVIYSVLFPEINHKRFSELPRRYQRRFEEYRLDFVNFYGSEDCLEYFGRLYGN